MVNLTTLAPDIVAAILDDTLPDTITLLELSADPPVLWGKQRPQGPALPLPYYMTTDHLFGCGVIRRYGRGAT